ncbi:MAG: hypothetical protein M0T69_09965 [Deltaproteobacteria bacterium]|nr:hypothetical protein [Deltaproteobacteria bacterium]
MEEEGKGKQESTGTQASTETAATGEPQSVESRRGPGWKAWVLSILAAIILSVTATLLLGGSGSFRSDRAAAEGAGRSCCPPAVAEK